MAGDLAAVTAARVALVQSISQFTAPAGVVITAGQVVGLDSSGYLALARATTGPVIGRGIALNGASLAGIAVTVLRKGIVDLGDIFSGLAYSDDVFYSDTAGVLADTVVSARPAVGYVTPGYGSTTPDKLLYVDM